MVSLKCDNVFFLMAIRKDLAVTPQFPAFTRHIKLPQGYENAHMVALGGAETPTLFNYQNQTHHYINPPESNPNLPYAVTAQEALHDLPAIDVNSITKGARKFDKLSKYHNGTELSQYVRMMRQWPQFESKEGVWDHVTRYLPRDYKLFRRMRHGDQYPEAYRLAEQMFEEALQEYQRETGIRPQKGTQEYHDLRYEYIPPYDPGKFPNKWRKMEPDTPSRTLTAHIGKDTYSHIHYDSEQSRVISVREAARLQSFPDGFKFEGAMNAAFRQIGNAVPPLQSYAIAARLKQLLDEALVQQEHASRLAQPQYSVT